MAATATTPRRTDQSLFDIYNSHDTPLDTALAAFQEEFDDTEIFAVLVEWGVGIPDSSRHYGAKQSYELFLGVKCEEIMSFGLTQGSDLRALGINTDIKFYCNRLEKAVGKEREALFSIITENLKEQARLWKDEKGCLYYIKLIDSFSISKPSSEEILQLNSELIELYKKNDLALLRTHLQVVRAALHGVELQPTDSSESTCIFKKWELFQKLKEAALSPDKDDIQVIMLEIQANVTKKEYSQIAGKLFFCTAKMHKASGAAERLRKYGIKAFLHQNEHSMTAEEQIQVIEQVSALNVLFALRELITTEQHEKIALLLGYLEQIDLGPNFHTDGGFLATYFFQTLWEQAGRPDTAPADYSKGALANAIPLVNQIKLEAVRRTIWKLHNYINN
jgi:hypothetical protein